MDGFSWSLLFSGIAVGWIHTALGSDHYVPLAVLSRSRGWSAGRTTLITAACGAAHVLSSVVLCLVLVGLGVAATGLDVVERGRGTAAAWLLVAFGLGYAVWGARRALRRSRGLELHSHGSQIHLHCRGDHPHEHRKENGAWWSFWPLFTVFVLGPCEPLIPLMAVPILRGRWDAALLTTLAFSVTTIGTMVVLTAILRAGLRRFEPRGLERWRHALAGAVIAGSGVVVLVLGL